MTLTVPSRLILCFMIAFALVHFGEAAAATAEAPSSASPDSLTKLAAPDEGQSRPKRQYYNNYYGYGYSYPGYNNGYGNNYYGYGYNNQGYNNGYGNGYYGNQGYGYGNNGWYLASSNYQSHREPGSTSATGGFRCIGIDCFGHDEPKSCLRRWCMDG